MDIIVKDLDSLKGADYNPRKELKPGDKEYEKLKRSIETFGYVDPIIWNKRTNTVVGGHQRISVLRDLGYTSVEVVEVDISLEEEKALNIALNKVSGEWDAEKLEDLLRDLSLDDNIDVELTGFDLDELETLFNGSIEEIEDTLEDVEEEDYGPKGSKRKAMNEEENIVDEDTFDAEEELIKAIENTKAKKGDLYKLGNHYLLCGDSTSRKDLEALTNKEKIKLCLTDPPYGVDVVKTSGKHAHDTVISKDENGKTVCLNKVGGDRIIEGKVVKANLYIPIKGDKTTDTAKLNYEIIKDITDNQVIFGGNYFTDFLPPRACWLVWNKHAVANFAAFELAWTSYTSPAKMYDFLWAGLCKRGSKKDEGVKRVHPTQKPVGMLCMILEDFTEENDTVLDCFGGSGSTLIACEKLNRQCYMVEYEPYYIDVIIKRWEDYTGKKAEFIRNITE